MLAIVGSMMCLKTISLTLDKSIALINNVAVKPLAFVELNKILTTTDIKNKIIVVNQLLTDMKGRKLSNCVQTSINNLHNIINLINIAINAAMDRKEQHEQLYFNYWRPFDISALLQDLSNYIDIFDKRFDQLVKLLLIS